jgi:3-oxoadipate enol-lactonase
MGFRDGPKMAWVHSEMTRHNARDIAEAGRELGRFDSRPWLAPLPVPAAVVMTTADEAVPPFKQRQLADALRATVFEAPVRHLDVAVLAGEESARSYNPVLIAALDALRAADASGSLAANES